MANTTTTTTSSSKPSNTRQGNAKGKGPSKAQAKQTAKAIGKAAAAVQPATVASTLPGRRTPTALQLAVCKAVAKAPGIATVALVQLLAKAGHMPANGNLLHVLYTCRIGQAPLLYATKTGGNTYHHETWQLAPAGKAALAASK